ISSDYTLDAHNFRQVRATSGGGADGVILNGSSGSDLFVTTAAYASAAGPGLDDRAMGYPNVSLYGLGGIDQAYLYDTPQTDAFVSTASYTSMRSLFVSVSCSSDVEKQFLRDSAGGNDTLWVYDSPGNDTLIAGPASSSIEDDRHLLYRQ